MKTLFYNNETPLTIGTELEFQVLDQGTFQLTPRAGELIRNANSNRLIHEFFQSTLEVFTGICKDVHQVETDLDYSISHLINDSKFIGVRLASTGTHPQADYHDRLVTVSDRYKDLVVRNQWMVLRRAVYGMHIHLGMTSGDECIAFNNFFLHFVPHLIALSASSPFWQKHDTGLAACRLTTYEAMPTAGIPYLVKNWKEFQSLIGFLEKSDSIRSLKDLWWDVRPSPSIGTLELRMMDVPATRKEAIGINAFVHALAHWYYEHQKEWSKFDPSLKHWIYRENKWRAIRYGLDASIIVTHTGRTKYLREDISEWMEKLDPIVGSLEYHDFLSILKDVLIKGNSSQRQRNVYIQTNSMGEVIKHNVMEFERGEPIWK